MYEKISEIGQLPKIVLGGSLLRRRIFCGSSVMGDGSEEEGAVPAARIPSESPKQPAVMERREEKETPRDRDREMDRDRSPPRRFHDKHDAVENPGTVYVGRLSHETDERALRGFFETYGKVLDAKVRARR